MVVVYVVLAVAVVAAIYFLFLRPSAARPEELPDKGSSTEPKALEKAPPKAPSTAPRPEAEATPEQAQETHPEAEAVKPPEAAPSAADQAKGESAPQAGVAAAAISDSSISLRPDRAQSDARLARGKALPSGPPSFAHVRNIEGLRRGLEKSRAKEGFFGRLVALFAGKKEIDPDLTTHLEEVLLSSDVGTKTTETLLSRVRDQLSRGELADADAVWASLRDEALRVLTVGERAGAFSLRAKPTVVLLVGVNGVGKTTTIGKLATRLKSEGRQVILAAGDTFRAAAVQQLVVWGNRVGVEVVRGKDGADPGSVIFEAVQRAKQVGADVVLADTAGRLHTKSNLMAELKKVVKTTSKALEGAPHEILLVVDATNGQNAMAQAAEFQQAMPLTGVVLTKLDGTAKGGVVLGISDSLGLPVRFVGLGETANDLHDFVPEEFVEALLGREN
jgi:fused signal recognition particle receptor